MRIIKFYNGKAKRNERIAKLTKEERLALIRRNIETLKTEDNDGRGTTHN